MCLIAMRTMTLAIKGKRLLDSRGIYSEIVNIEPALTKRGCAYGLKLGCENVAEATGVFIGKNLSFGEILGR